MPVRGFAHVACLFRSSRGKVKNALYYEIFKEQRPSFPMRKTGKGFVPSPVSSFRSVF